MADEGLALACEPRVGVADTAKCEVEPCNNNVIEDEDNMSEGESKNSKTSVCSDSSEEDYVDLADVYTVEKIVGKRKHPETGVTEYRIKWDGYPASDNTWEPTDNIYDKKVIEQYEYFEELKERKRKEKQEERQKILQLQKQKKKEAAKALKIKKKRVVYTYSDSDSDEEKEVVPGYSLGYTLEKIIGACRKNSKLHYLLKYNERSCPELVLHTIVGEKYPDILIEYLQENCHWIPS